MYILQVINDYLSAPSFEWFDKLNAKFALRLGADLATMILLVRFIYYRIYRRADLFLTFFSFNLIIFLITFLLNKAEMTMGAAFGIFAVFSLLRYRTENISAKDMTYLFIAIAVGLIMAVSRGGWDELALIGGIVLVFTQLLESNWIVRRELSQQVLYENILLVQAGNRPEMIADLAARTGLDVHRVDIQEIDFVKDAARLTIYYYEKKQA
ncbi:DUF4956 domain-containing protein [Paraflavisolibacter sp. H34]|uniref:DUF4956 domain-containing protein n=1 Tax=Huijunlia imazamoxiresistens TaxID=3127457 RepID=UPI0030164EED